MSNNVVYIERTRAVDALLYGSGTAIQVRFSTLQRNEEAGQIVYIGPHDASNVVADSIDEAGCKQAIEWAMKAAPLWFMRSAENETQKCKTTVSKDNGDSEQHEDPTFT